MPDTLIVRPVRSFRRKTRQPRIQTVPLNGGIIFGIFLQKKVSSDDAGAQSSTQL